MGRARSHKKNIACVESLFDGNIETRLSVVPLLELASRVDDIKFSYLTCNTEEELKYNLGKLKHRRGYGILYLSFHGRPGELVLDQRNDVEVEKLAQYMGKGFANWVVHFGSCATIDVPQTRMSRFIAATAVSVVLGYKKDVDWIDSAAIDLLLFGRLQEYRDMQRFWAQFRHRYHDLVAVTGLRAFIR